VNKHFQLKTTLLLLAVIAVTTQCTFRSPTTQTVAPSGSNDATAKVEKSFFVGKDKSGRQKRFIFGVAPERELGWVAEVLNTHGVPEFEHANLEFRVTEKYLVGLKVNPSYPNDSSRWSELIKIPITSHYYHEPRKDQTGRNANEMIENTERSHWSARPFIKLDLTGTKLVNRSFGHNFYTLGFEGAGSISDIEFDMNQGFLGFSLRTDGGGSAVNQAVYRVNLKSFDHNPNFKKTPFHEQNYKFMNVLHVMGQKTETQEQVLFAAHWDLSKQHKILLTGFPKQYEKLGIATVEAWNKTLQDIGAVSKDWRPFIPVVKELKHAFDLRYTAMHWVQDIRISQSSPLGVGVTTADSSNGEIIWGKVTVYGGYIDDYVKGNTPAVSAAKSGRVRFFDSLFSAFGLNKVITAPPQIESLQASAKDHLNLLNSENLMKIHAEKLTEALRRSEQERHKRERTVPTDIDQKTQITPEQIRTLYTGMKQSLEMMNSQGTPQLTVNQLSQAYGLDRLMSRIGQAGLDEEDAVAKHLRTLTPKKQFEFMAQRATRTDCSDRTFADVAPGWSAALKASGGADLQFIVDSIIYELLLHEMGHMIGLGHQFKENILPEKDKVPAEIYERLAAKATPEAGYGNSTSVMGYRSPRAEIADYEFSYKKGITDPTKTSEPGEQDKLVLRYLYKQQFATYVKGAKDFNYLAVPQNGIIPVSVKGKNGTVFRTSYFPQCNDGEASFGLDPYCNRFDRGPDAKTIVSSYFDDLKDTLIQRLIAFSDTREVDAQSAEYYLWLRSLRTFSRVRVFYDYMRAKLETEAPAETRKLLQNEEALYDFSNACTTGAKNPGTAGDLNALFAKSPQLKELCEVNQIAIREFSKILSLPVSDHAKVDFENYFFPAGLTGGEVDYDYSRVIGTWRELGAFPMKFAALLAMQTPTPFVSFGSWLFPIPNYDTPERRYAYVSLYPREYTEAQTAAVKNNLLFANVHAGEATRIGKTVLYMGFLPHMIGQHNDSSRLPPQFVQRLRGQANFDISFVAILLKKSDNQADKYIAKKFNPTIYDLNTGKEANATEAYLMPEGEVIVRAENAFLIPVSKFQFLDDEMGFVFSIRLTFYDDDEDVLNSVSPKTALKDLHDQTISACLRGKDSVQNGLSMFFNPTNDKFKGFLMPPNISRDKEKQRQFRDSIRLAYTEYYKHTTARPSTCQDAVQGLRMVVSSAAILNGYWLSYAADYIQN